DVEAGHGGIRDRQYSGFAALQKERNDRTARTHDIAVTHHGQRQLAVSAQVVGGDEQLVRAEFGGSVEVDGGGGLVGGQSNNPRHTAVQHSFNQILRAQHIGLDALEGVV